VNSGPRTSVREHRSERTADRIVKSTRIAKVIRIAGVGVLATAAIAQTPPPQPPPSFVFSSGQSSLCVPVEVVANGLVLMQAAVNGHSGWFILDNASQGFTVDAEFARRNSLYVADRAHARGGGASSIDAGVVHDVRISLQGLDLDHRNLVVIALKAIEPAIGHTVDGIFGFASVRRSNRCYRLRPALRVDLPA